MNVIARLEHELVYYDSAVHRFNHYTTRTPPLIFLFRVKCFQVFLFNISNSFFEVFISNRILIIYLIPHSRLNGRNSTICLHGPISIFNSFQNLQIPRTISSGHDLIHTPASTLVWGLLWQWWLLYPSPRERKTAPNHFALNQETRTVQSLTKLNDKI